MKSSLFFTKIFYVFFSIFLSLQSAFAAAQTTSSQFAPLSFSVSGEGKALVLIHAFPTDQRLWTLQVEGLSNHFRVITIDLLGFGHAKKVSGEAITMSQYAEQVKTLLDELKVDKAIVGGESMGGYVALAFLKSYPERVSGLILSDTQTIADTQAIKSKRESTALDVLAHGSTKLIQDFMPKALSANASEKTRAFLQNILEQQTSTAIASALRGMALREDTSHLLSKTLLPVLIISGDEDTVISPSESQKMHALAKNSRLVMIEKAGHLSSLEHPRHWNQAVIDMFAS